MSRMIEVAPHDRPREKLERRGLAALGDNELLAVVIGHGTSRTGALALANQILALAGGTHGLTRLHRDRLTAIPGVGPAVASRIQAAIELGRRTLSISPPARPQFTTAQELAQYLLPEYGAHPVERFGLVLLDTKHRLIGVRIVSVGSLDTSTAHPRDVFREAAVAGAAALVLFHNHPSGDASPSAADIEVTARLVEAGTVMGIAVLDHLVLADTRFCSIRTMNVLQMPGTRSPGSGEKQRSR